MYRIYWKHINGACGNGEGTLNYSTAKAWMDKGNKDYPDIKHTFREEKN